MATDYDAPRRNEADENVDETLTDFAGRRNDASTAVLDLDDGDMIDAVDLPGGDLSGEELVVRVLPKQADEFTCSRCFLVHHRHRLALQQGTAQVCADCV